MCNKKNKTILLETTFWLPQDIWIKIIEYLSSPQDINRVNISSKLFQSVCSTLCKRVQGNISLADCALRGDFFGIKKAIQQGDDDWDQGMLGAIHGNHTELVHFFIQKGASNMTKAFLLAVKQGNRILVDLFAQKINCWYVSDQAMGCAARGGHMDLVLFSIEKHRGFTSDWTYGMVCATRGGHDHIIEFFMQKNYFNLTDQIWKTLECKKQNFNNPYQGEDYTYITKAMVNAALCGRKDLVERFVGMGSTAWNWGLACGAKSGNQDLVLYFIEKGANGWDIALSYAARGGNKYIIDLLIEKGANDWNKGLEGASRGGRKDFVEFFIGLGANDLNSAMIAATEGGHKDLVLFLIEKGANNWNSGMSTAAKRGRKDLVILFLSKRATNWTYAARAAEDAQFTNLAKYIRIKGAQQREQLKMPLRIRKLPITH